VICITCSAASLRFTFSSTRTKNRAGNIEEVIEGSTIGEVLSTTQWDEAELMRLLKSQVDDSIKTDFLKPSDAMKLLYDYERLLQEYT
jgi:arginine decarboxylase